MGRKEEIGSDIWEIMRKVYQISEVSPQSQKQEAFINSVVEYIDSNLSTRRKKPDKVKNDN
jgi:hypothetical protein